MLTASQLGWAVSVSTPYRRGYAAERTVLEAFRRCPNVVFATRLPASKPADILALIECGDEIVPVLVEVKRAKRCQKGLQRLREALRALAAQLGSRLAVLGVLCVAGRGCRVIDAGSVEEVTCEWEWGRLPRVREVCGCGWLGSEKWVVERYSGGGR